MDRLHSRRDHARTGETAVHQPTPTSASQPGSFQAVTPSPRKQHDLVFDVGLHKGEDTEFYLEKGFRVVAFEADPDLAAHCRERFAAQLREGRLVIVEGAIVATTPGIDAPRTVTFYKNLDKTVWGTTQAAWADRNARLGTRVQEIVVPVVDFAEALARHGIPRYLKIDIEGCDRACLDALARHDEKPDFLSIESDKKSFARLAAEIATLQALGYTRFAAVQQGSVQRQREPDPPREGRAAGHAFRPGSSGLFGLEAPAPWRTAQGILAHYRRIFRLYRWFGDDSLFARNRYARKLLRAVEKLAGRRIPGWYDTHARLDEAR